MEGEEVINRLLAAEGSSPPKGDDKQTSRQQTRSGWGAEARLRGARSEWV